MTTAGGETEAQLTKKILAYLKGHGFFFKIHGDNFQTRGLPDVVGCLMGRFVAFEIKRPGRERSITVLQIKALDDIHLSGGHAYLVSSLQEVQSIVIGLKKAIGKEQITLQKSGRLDEQMREQAATIQKLTSSSKPGVTMVTVSEETVVDRIMSDPDSFERPKITGFMRPKDFKLALKKAYEAGK